MLAIAHDSAGNVCGGQLTWLTQGGQKSTREPVRQTLPFTSAGRKQGLVRFGNPSIRSSRSAKVSKTPFPHGKPAPTT